MAAEKPPTPPRPSVPDPRPPTPGSPVSEALRYVELISEEQHAVDSIYRDAMSRALTDWGWRE